MKKIINNILGYEKSRKLQASILKRLKDKKTTLFDRFMVDNITLSDYADFLWPHKSVAFRCHFMFHTPMEFNGFVEGRPMTEPHYDGMAHCCYCGNEKECSDLRIKEN